MSYSSAVTKSYQICKQTIMDTTDPNISFDQNGVSNYVNDYNNLIQNGWNPEGDKEKLAKLLNNIKNDKCSSQYNCIIGVSGGLDSSYLVHFAYQNNLRPLIVHVDTGWNSELAVRNIEKLINKTGFDLTTIVIDWESMKELQLSFFKSGVPNQDIPQDHAIFASFYNTAVENRIKWVLNGSNFSTESILPIAWGYNAGDWRHIKAIHYTFSNYKLKKFPHMGYIDYAMKLLINGKLKVVKPLNLIKYSRSSAIQVLQNTYDWKYYGGKHYESRFTKFFQSWYLPQKHGYDKRKAHLSSLILSGEITREDAINIISTLPFDDNQILSDLDYVANKLGLTTLEFQDILSQPIHSHEDFPTSTKFLQYAKKIKSYLIN